MTTTSMIVDFLGRELNVGDKVVYCGIKHFEIKTIKSFKEVINYGRTEPRVVLESGGATLPHRLIKLDYNNDNRISREETIR